MRLWWRQAGARCPNVVIVDSDVIKILHYHSRRSIIGFPSETILEVRCARIWLRPRQAPSRGASAVCALDAGRGLPALLQELSDAPVARLGALLRLLLRLQLLELLDMRLAARRRASMGGRAL